MSSHDSGGAPLENPSTPTTHSSRRAAQEPSTREGNEVRKMAIFALTAWRGKKEEAERRLPEAS